MTEQMHTSLSNWGENYTYQAQHILYPQSIEALQDIVRTNQQVKALGSRHSFNHIADTPDTLISTANLTKIIDLDAENHTVTVEAGVTYGQLCPYLDERGFALPNLASLPHITVVGACMTGTHGSGVNNGNLATSVKAIHFVGADGTHHTVTHEDADFKGMVVGLGAFGIVTSITLRIIPAFEMWQQIFLQLPHTTLRQHYAEIVNSAYSVSLFTSWQHDYIDQVWLKDHAENPTVSAFFDANLATTPIHPVPGGDTQATTEQLGKIGKWYDRLPHFRLGFQPSSGREIQSEYFVSIENAVEAIDAIRSMQSSIAPLLFISELRTVDADDLWLSPCYGRASIGIHFTWKPEQAQVENILPRIEEKLTPFAVRPHWGKVYTLDPAYVRSQYAQFSAFTDLVRKYDPDGKFSNPFLRALL